jgi:hypothetical protein
VYELQHEDMFTSQIIGVISDYGDKGFPVSLIPRRWNQIWPQQPFPPAHHYCIEIDVVDGNTGQLSRVSKKVKLLRFLRYKCMGLVRFRQLDGKWLAFRNEPPTQSLKDDEIKINN